MKNEITAKRLMLALSKAEIKAQALADGSGVSKASISQYINGSHKPSNISSGKMAKILHVNPLWLMGFDVPMEEKKKIVTSTTYNMTNWMKHTENEQELLAHFSKLNLNGEEEAIKRLKELIYVPDYTENQEEWLVEIPGTSKTFETTEDDTDNDESSDNDMHSFVSSTTIQLSDLFSDKNESYLIPQAAHERTDIEVTEEMRQHDDDIMEDDKFWK